MNAEQVREKIKTIIQLPALPAIAMEVVELVDNPKTSASKLGKVIASDQALTAKVLKIANSPFYGFPKKISTIDFAIIVLGFDALKEIVISISLISSLQRRSDKYFDPRLFWDHSITTGVVGRRLARDLGYRISGEVFVAGLLHDMGISVLHRYFESEFMRIVEIVSEDGLTMLEAEESVLGVTHAEIGGWLAERWNLPDHLIEAICYHHTPANAKINRELVSLVHCSDVIANTIAQTPFSFDNDVTFEKFSLELLRLNDTAVLDEYIQTYRSVINADVEQIVAMA
jgi:HD-like signal output (HDOD) protein